MSSRGVGSSPRRRNDPSRRFEEALLYATRVHASQKRNRTEIPYISHPLAVASLVMEAGGDEDQAIAGLLHDTAEDHGGLDRILDIRKRFGDRVARIVEGCSDNLTMPAPPWRERKQRYLEHLRTAADDVVLVSVADKLHNARTVLADYRQIGDEVWERFQGGRDYVLWYLRELVQIFLDRRAAMAEELQRVVEETIRLMRAR